MKTPTGKWTIQVGKGKSSYITKYSFDGGMIVPSRAILYYNSLNTHSGYKKRLIDPKGQVRARVIT